MAAVDWTDPCARAIVMREAYFRLVSGAQEISVSYTGNGVTREVKYSEPNLQYLLSEIRTAEAECAGVSGVPAARPRYAIQAGSRRVQRHIT